MQDGIFVLKGHPHDNLGVLRTGAAHPLPDFSGCVRTRRTRSNGSPDNIWIVSFLMKLPKAYLGIYK